MSKPRLLDLYCGAGGCAAGYVLAGFEVHGVDREPQPRYLLSGATAFVQADALEYLAGHGRDFDAIHASPPCQAYSITKNIHGRSDHPRLIEPTRKLLEAIGKPWVIENVVGAPLNNPATVCGLGLGLRVKRHRWFEGSFLLFGGPCGDHSSDYVIVFGGGAKGRGKTIGRTEKGGPMIRRPFVPVEQARQAMGIGWMSRDELSQAVPPAYTEFIGRQLYALVAARFRPRCPRCGERRWTLLAGEPGNDWDEPYCAACRKRFSSITLFGGERRYYPDFDPEDVT